MVYEKPPADILMFNDSERITTASSCDNWNSRWQENCSTAPHQNGVIDLGAPATEESID